MRVVYSFILLIGVLLVSCTNEEKQPVKEAKEPVSTIKDPELMALNEKVKANINDVEARIDRLEYCLLQNYTTEAMSDALYLIKRDTMNADYWGYLGKARFVNREVYQAFNCFERGMSLSNNCLPCADGMATLKLFQKKYGEALEWSNTALKMDEQYFMPYFTKGWIYMEVGDTNKAVSSFTTALELNPDFYEAFIMLGTLYFKAKDDLAIEYFNSAKRIQPNNPEPLYFIGSFYQGNEEMVKAKSAYRELLKVDSTYALANFNLGYIYMTHDYELDSAIQSFTKAVQNNANYFEAYHNRGLCKLEKGMVTAAEADFKLALGINPDFVLARKELQKLQ